MSKKVKTIEEPHKACLTMPADEFQSALENRIALGKELLNIKVTRNTIPYGMSGYAGLGYVSQEERQYNKQEIEAFKKEYKKWTSYNSELLKQAFDIPENEYKREYDDAGEIILVGHEDVMEEYHKKINRKIAALERLIDQLPLLPKSNVSKTPSYKESDVSKSKKVFIVQK